MANALAAIAAARLAGIDDAVSRLALASFAGIGRRFDRIGSVRGIDVVDDFAHNPDKIRATLAGSAWGRRRLLVFQPHGYGPTRFLLNDLIASFANGMVAEDLLFVSAIYYAGGTATKDVSGADIARGVTAGGKQARFLPTRTEILEALIREACSGDLVIVMGARDDTLTEFCGEILLRLRAGGPHRGAEREMDCFRLFEDDDPPRCLLPARLRADEVDTRRDGMARRSRRHPRRPRASRPAGGPRIRQRTSAPAGVVQREVDRGGSGQDEGEPRRARPWKRPPGTEGRPAPGAPSSCADGAGVLDHIRSPRRSPAPTHPVRRSSTRRGSRRSRRSPRRASSACRSCTC